VAKCYFARLGVLYCCRNFSRVVLPQAMKCQPTIQLAMCAEAAAGTFGLLAKFQEVFFSPCELAEAGELGRATTACLA